MLLRGYELLSLNIIPQIQASPVDEDYVPENSCREVIENYLKLRKSNNILHKVYNSEFLVQLMSQAIDKRDRYKPVSSTNLQVGDIVLLVEKYSKQSNYPMGIVEKIETNRYGDVTAAVVLKGKTGERVYRHATSLILILSKQNYDEQSQCEEKISISAQKYF